MRTPRPTSPRPAQSRVADRGSADRGSAAGVAPGRRPSPSERPAARPVRRVPEENPGFLLWRASLRWQRAVAAALAPLDLTPVQYILLTGLRRLEARGEEPNQAELAGYAGIDVKTVSQALRKLEHKRLLTREVDRTDIRARLLRTTAAGAGLSAAAVRVVEAADAAFFRTVGNREQVVAVLRALGGAGR